MFSKHVPPRGQRPTVGKKVDEDNIPPHCVASYIEQEVKAGGSLYGALYDAYDGYGVSGDVVDWIAENEDIFAREWLKARGVI